ncbi:MAG: tetratricopeptide repeat protein [Calditrichaeota bacterium]|nr:tetratricopeptide repeat protein [Calditrichota bacterium]
MQADSSLLWMFIIAIGAVLTVALYSWEQKRRLKKPAPRDPYTDGLNYMLAGRLREAAKAFTEAVRADTGNIDAYLKLGAIFRALGKPRRAIQIHLELSVRGLLAPHIQASIYRELAQDLEQAGMFDKAHEYLDKSRSLDPECADDFIIRLRMLEKQNRWKDAGEALKKRSAVTGKSDPEKTALYKLMEGEAFCAESREHDGRVVFKDALRIDPQAFEGMLFIAASYARENRSAEAFEWLTKFIKMRPNEAHLALPVLEPLLFNLGRFGEVEAILREAFDVAPANRLLALALMDLRSKKGEYREALDICERALEQNPKDAALLLQKLRLIYRLNLPDFERHLNDTVDWTTGDINMLFCSLCGEKSERLALRCANCGAWRTFYRDRRKIHGV